jgi:hypothetical protein
MELRKMKEAQKPKAVRTCIPQTTRQLYSQPDMKRLMVFVNGEKIELAQYVWGETIAQILDNSTVRLKMAQSAKYLFTLDGNLVDNLQSLKRDEIVCVSVHKKFLRPQESQRFIEVKANWVRSCRHRGHPAGDVDDILFSPDPQTDQHPDTNPSARCHGDDHTHFVELTANDYNPCPTCRASCIIKTDIPASARQHHS